MELGRFRNLLQLDPEDEYLRGLTTPCVTKRKVYAKVGRHLLHRKLTDCPRGLVVDHLNGNSLDNRKENLRVTTHSGNNRNTQRLKFDPIKTPFRGVSYCRDRNKFSVRLRVDGRSVCLGYYSDPAEANIVRLTRERKEWGISPSRLPDFIAAGLEV